MTFSPPTDNEHLPALARYSLRDWFGLTSCGELDHLLGMDRQYEVLGAYVMLRAFLRNDRDERQRWLRHEGLELMRAGGGYAALAAAVDERFMVGVRPYRPGLAPIKPEVPPLPAVPHVPRVARDVRAF